MIAAFLTSIWSRVTGYAIAIGAALAILFAAYRKGAADNQAKRAEQRLKSIKKAREVENEVDRLGDDAVDRELDRWMRHD